MQATARVKPGHPIDDLYSRHKNRVLTGSLSRCRMITLRSMMLLEGRMTGSFIRVHCTERNANTQELKNQQPWRISRGECEGCRSAVFRSQHPAATATESMSALHISLLHPARTGTRHQRGACYREVQISPYVHARIHTG